MYRLQTLSLAAISLFTAGAFAQPPSDAGTKSAQAVSYPVGESTKVGFKASDLMPGANGTAKVTVKKGYAQIEAEFKQLNTPTKFGAEFLTFVLWSVSPEGRPTNLGEILTDHDGCGRVKVSSQMQTFSLFVTAEPYFSVKTPSELLILENEFLPGTKGKRFVVTHYPLMRRARYQKMANPLVLEPDLRSHPLEIYEARNAVAIAQMNAAEQYSPESLKKAAASLKMAEQALKQKKDRKEIVSLARQAVQFSDDALNLSLERQETERLENERKAREAAERRAQEQAHQEAIRRAQAEADRARAEAAQARAQLAQQEARNRAEREAQLRAQAEAERQREAAAREDAERQLKKMEDEKADLRARLLKQFSVVLDTRDSERGLIVNMPDVLFDTGSYTLRPQAREKLARIAGIVVNYPKLKLEAEGHTDNVGSAELNLKLSEKRASEVRMYLVNQGVPVTSVTWSGKGYELPVASNDTAAGRKKNRRVELIVSGEVIGTAVSKIEQ